MEPAHFDKVLHIGPGKFGELPDWIVTDHEVRVDIDPASEADYIASMTDMAEIEPDQFDLVFSSHCLEHLYPHEVDVALREMLRVLKPGGVMISVVPDLEDVKLTTETVYESPAGPVSGLDMIYGFRPAMAVGNLWMAHHTGFTQHILFADLIHAGFDRVTVIRATDYNLIGSGGKPNAA